MQMSLAQILAGYGDVAVPGLLVVLMRRFDVATGRTWSQGYMLAVLLAYSAGILLTDAALAFEVFGSQGQPALMYLVPCTLATVWLLAWRRGDCAALWAGRVDDVKDHASGSDDQDRDLDGLEGLHADTKADGQQNGDGSSALQRRADDAQESQGLLQPQ